MSALVTDNGGEVEKTDEWGKRRLAYPINYKNEGYYVLVNFTAPPELPKEIERVLQINESVLRYLVIRLEEKHTSVKPRAIPLRPTYSRPPEPIIPGADPEAESVAAPAVTPEATAPQATATATENLEAVIEHEAGVAPGTLADAMPQVEEVIQTEASEPAAAE